MEKKLGRTGICTVIGSRAKETYVSFWLLNYTEGCLSVAKCLFRDFQMASIISLCELSIPIKYIYLYYLFWLDCWSVGQKFRCGGELHFYARSEYLFVYAYLLQSRPGSRWLYCPTHAAPSIDTSKLTVENVLWV